METDYKIILGALAALILIAQITLVGFKLQEKKETRKFLNGDNNPKSKTSHHSMIPGFAVICIEHAKKLVRIETSLKNIVSQRKEDHAEGILWKTEMRDNFKRIFDKIEK